MAVELEAIGRDTQAGGERFQVTLVAENGAGDANGQPPTKTTTIALETGNVVHLPAGTDLSHPLQVGNDLEFVQPDGSIVLIPNGAVAGLTVYVGNVEIPPDTVTALFAANHIQPAEGPNGQAQGGHEFNDPGPGGIGNAFGLTPLLGPTDLSFGSTGTQPRYPANITPEVGTPTVTADFDTSTHPLVVKEDNSATVTFHAAVASGTDDVLTKADITGLDPTATYTINGGTPITGVDHTSVSFGTNITAQDIAISVQPKQDSDVDLGTITVTVTAADGNNPGVTTTQSASAGIVVDAVLDDAVALGGSPSTVTGTESTSASSYALGLTANVVHPFTYSGDGGADTDGSEQGTATVTLGAALPVGAAVSLAGTYTGSAQISVDPSDATKWTISGFTDAADLKAAIGALQVTNLPAGFDGTISGTLAVSFAEANAAGTVVASGAEPDATDDTYSSSQSFSLSIAAQVGTPSIQSDVQGPSLVIKEDETGTVTFTANAAATDVITKVTIGGLDAHASYVINGTTVAGSVGSYDVVFTTPLVQQTVTVVVTPPQDSDVDLSSLTATATAKDADHTDAGDPSVVSAPTTIPVVVDAVLDDAVALGGSPSTVTGTESTSASSYALGLTANVVHPFTYSGDGGADTDGSEQGTATVTLGAALPVGAAVSLAGTYTGSAQISVDPSDATKWTISGFTDAADLKAAIGALQVTNLPAGFDGTISGTLAVSFAEANAAGTVVASGAEPDATDDTYSSSQSFSLSIAAQVGTPSIQSDVQGPSLVIKEDETGTVTFTANAAATDVITKVTIGGLDAHASYVINGTTVAGSVGSYDVVFTTPLVQQTVTVVVTPPQDSDVDLSSLTATATAKDADHTDAGDPSVVSAPTTIPVVVDAVLDDAVALGGSPSTVTGTESTSASSYALGLTANVVHPFTYSGDGGADTDGSEQGTATVTLGAALPVGAAVSLAGTYTGSAQISVDPSDATKWTISGFTDAADLKAAIGALQVTNLPAGFDGTISGTLAVSFAEANAAGTVVASGAEPDATDDTYSSSQSFSLSIAAQVGTPSIQSDVQGPSLVIKEDETGTVTFTANAAATDVITKVTIGGLDAHASYVINGTTVAGSVGSYDVVFTTPLVQQTVTVVVTPPQDSDVDLSSLTATATAKDADHTDAGDPSVVSAPTTIPVVVDAVLDNFVDASSGTPVSSAVTGSSQTLSLGLTATLATTSFTFAGAGGLDTDGSEVAKATITLNSALPSGATLAATGAAISLTGSGTTYTLVGTEAQVQDALTKLQVTVPGSFIGTISGTVSTTSSEANTPPGSVVVASGQEPDASDNTVTDPTAATFSVSITNSAPTGGGTVSLTVDEAALDKTLDSGPPADLQPGVVTGSNPSSPAETAQATTGITFTATGEALNVAFADPTNSGWVAPTFSGLATGYSLSWVLSGGQLIGHLIDPTSNDLGAFVYLALTGTHADPGGSITPTITATLVDNLIDAPSASQVVISGIPVVATDTSGDTAPGSVNLTVLDDAPTITSIDNMIVSNHASASATGTIHFVAGADSPATMSLAANVAPSNLTSGGLPVSYYVDPANPLTLVAYTGSDHTANNVFTLTLDATTGAYTFTALQALDAFTDVQVGGSTAVAGGPKSALILTSSSGAQLSLLSAWHADSGFSISDWKNGNLTTDISLHDVNGSSGGFGVDSNNVNQNDILRFDFGSTNDYDGGGVYVPPATSLANVTSATFSFTKTTTIDYVIHYVDGTLSSGSFTSGASNTVPSISGTKYIDFIELYSEGAAGKVQLSDTTTVTNTGTTDLSFNVTVSDQDSDQATGTVNIKVDGDHSLAATAGTDAIGPATTVGLGGSGDTGTISGYETITGFDTANDYLDLHGTPSVAANAIVNGADSVLTIAGQTIKSHSISSGVITFDDANTYSSALTISTTSNLAAVVDYLERNNLGAGVTVAFTTTIGGSSHSFLYQQVGATANAANDILVELSGVTVSNLTTLVSGGHVDPIVLELDHSGYSFTSIENGVQFDINADGAKDHVAWTTPNEGLLAIDLNHDGKIDDGSELFTTSFNHQQFATGLDALASLDTNHDGMIDAGDVDFSNLVVWNDANGDGISQPSELTTLADNGISSIGLAATPTDTSVDGQEVTAEGTVTHVDGSTSGYAEVSLDTSLGSPTPLLGVTDSSSFNDGFDWGNIVVPPADGSNTLQGTDGADKFTLTDLHAVELIADYNFDQGDSIDLSVLLGHNSGVTQQNVADHVHYDSTTGALSVAETGAGGAPEFIDVAVLNHPVPDVKVVLDDGVDVTINHLG